MQYFVISLLVSVSALSKQTSADHAIVEGLARVVLLQQGVSPDEISQASIEQTQRSYEEALGYYDNYAFEETPTFSTTSGPVKGAKFNESYAFYSIPFAEPPVRFQAPVPIATPLSVIDATKADIVVCEQRSQNCSNGVCTQNTNEDCLLLNVHVPTGVEITDSGATTSVRPVFVWFHGGGFFTGGGTMPEFEARYFAEQTDAVIVSVNYRLSAFGFLVHGDGANAIEGNAGFKDQQLALQWVNANIKTFGGDPELVTIFGNSAGAQSVMLHLVSEKSKPYFKRAIMQSNPAVFPYQTPEEAKRVSDKLVRLLGCNGTLEEQQKCLMESDPSAINRALPMIMALSLIEDNDLYSTIEAFRPVMDGNEFVKQPLEAFRDGTWNTDKDVIIGTNANELEMIQYYIPDPIPFTESMFKRLNRFIFGNETGDVVSERYIQDYGRGPLTKYKIVLGFEASHMFFMCPSRAMARFASASSSSGGVYLYNNAQPMDGPTCPNVVKPSGMCGLAFHGAEPPFIFRSGPFYGYEFRSSDASAADQFDYYWTNFAVTGNPSEESSIPGVGHSLGPFESWPKYNGQQTYDVASLYLARLGMQERSTPWQNVVIDGDVGENTLQDAYLEDICDFWDSLNYYIDLNPTSGVTTSPPASTTANGATMPTVEPTSSTIATTVNVGDDVTTVVESTTSGSDRMRQNLFLMFLSGFLLSIAL